MQGITWQSVIIYMAFCGITAILPKGRNWAENFHDKIKEWTKHLQTIKILLYIFLLTWTEDTPRLEVTTMNQIEVAAKWKPTSDPELGKVFVSICKILTRCIMGMVSSRVPAVWFIQGGKRLGG